MNPIPILSACLHIQKEIVHSPRHHVQSRVVYASIDKCYQVAYQNTSQYHLKSMNSIEPMTLAAHQIFFFPVQKKLIQIILKQSNNNRVSIRKQSHVYLHRHQPIKINIEQLDLLAKQRHRQQYHRQHHVHHVYHLFDMHLTHRYKQIKIFSHRMMKVH